ncbi:hypothetical protein R3W88_033615 [Solanum pinnatisectum]|uniref:F-box associated beta-propeller type 1 domain-containing protein n=1 Tax=Solanum pinnatisectum TaxID=50273 RepID=A0AAV9K2A9_9SOLN|nr:hypothetical protein R3W88_033615 [Solanum pinnatisectum]
MRSCLSLVFTFDSPDILNCIVGSVNGLICFENINPEGHTIYFTNPSIKKLLILPPSSIYSDDSELQFRKMCIVFGYHERTNAYKVVHIGFIDHVWLNEEYNYEEAGEYDFDCRAEIFSLNTKVWKTLDLSHDCCYNRVDVFSRVVVNEYLHWKAIKSNTCENKMVILTFHIGDETFQDIECPIFCDGEEINQSIYLGEFRGKLGFLRSYPVKWEQPCYIWTMEEYGEMNSWTCQTIIVSGMPIQYPLAFTKNGQIIIRDKYGNIFSYDYNTNQLLDLHIQDGEFAMNFIDYIESLVLVNLNDDPTEDGVAEFDEEHVINMIDDDDPQGDASMDDEN